MRSVKNMQSLLSDEIRKQLTELNFMDTRIEMRLQIPIITGAGRQG